MYAPSFSFTVSSTPKHLAVSPRRDNDVRTVHFRLKVGRKPVGVAPASRQEPWTSAGCNATLAGGKLGFFTDPVKQNNSAPSTAKQLLGEGVWDGWDWLTLCTVSSLVFPGTKHWRPLSCSCGLGTFRARQSVQCRTSNTYVLYT